ncbi:MAG: hypothetical protein ACTHM6_19725 [Tepidisphaeraceae bacterium]
MTKTIYRSVTAVRRTSRPRTGAKRSAGFAGMLARLDAASATLQRRRRK